MDAWVLFRFTKFLGVALFAAGVLGSVLLPEARDRRTAAHVLATAGLIIVCVAGYGLVKERGLSIRDPWISRSLFAGLAAMFAAAWAAGRGSVPRLAGAIGLGSLVLAFGSMSTRDDSLLLNLVAPLGAAGLGFAVSTRGSEDAASDSVSARATFRWFAWIARAEGVSLLLLFGVYMPLKYAAQIQLDGGQGWFGWVHGVLQLLFLVALIVTSRVLGWSVVRTFLGFVASVVPFGTFIFESRVRPKSAS